jgi:hypothetical protein
MEIRKIGKKGDTTVEPIVVLSISVIVLALVGFGAYLQYSDKINFFRLLPDFNLAQGKQEAIQIISYNIEEDKIEYFDGESWVGLERGKGVDLGEKRVTERDLRRDLLINYWFSSGERETSEEFELSYEAYTDGVPSSSKEFVVRQKAKVILISETSEKDEGGFFYRILPGEIYHTKAGDIQINVNNIGSSALNRVFVLRYPDRIFILENNKIESVDNIPVLSQEIKEYFIEWRDSVLKKPVGIEYYDTDTKKDVKNKRFCVEKKEDRLVVRLDEPTSKGECEVND